MFVICAHVILFNHQIKGPWIIQLKNIEIDQFSFQFTRAQCILIWQKNNVPIMYAHWQSFEQLY